MDKTEILNVAVTKIHEMKGSSAPISENDYIDFRGAGLNSIELMTLIVYLEEVLDFESDDEELNLEKFNVIDDLVNLVIRFKE